VQQLTGGGVGINPITGRVDVGGVGWLADEGENVGLLPVISISTTLSKFLRSILAIADDTHQAEAVPAAACTVLCSGELLGS
jgi:predicted Zn-dependent protease